MSVITRAAALGLCATLLMGASSGSIAATDPAEGSATVAVATAAPTAPAAKRAAANPENQMVCKTETPTGSRLGGHKICMTKADWYQISNGARENMDKMNPLDRPVK